MLEKIKQLEQKARQLEPEAHQKAEWHQLSLNYANQFYEQLDSLPAFQALHEAALTPDTFHIPEQQEALIELLQQLKTQVDTMGINPASGGHFGYVPGGGLFPSALADYLAAATNRYAGLYFATPGAVKMENELIRWMCGLMGFPETALGNLTSGGSIANLTAITTARESRQLKARDFEKQVFYLTQQTHHCFFHPRNANGLLGAVVCLLSEIENLFFEVACFQLAPKRPFALRG
ncbi:MAG: pyridoxal-dependent decarboxylase [Bacteroidota bacterium]